MSNSEIIKAIFNKYLEWGYTRAKAQRTLNLMSTEDLTVFHSEHIKGNK